MTIEMAPKKLVNLVDGTSASFEQPQRAMVDGIPPFLLPYQCIFCSIITRRNLWPGGLIGGMTEVRDTGGLKMTKRLMIAVAVAAVALVWSCAYAQETRSGKPAHCA